MENTHIRETAEKQDGRQYEIQELINLRNMLIENSDNDNLEGDALENESIERTKTRQEEIEELKKIRKMVIGVSEEEIPNDPSDDGEGNINPPQKVKRYEKYRRI